MKSINLFLVTISISVSCMGQINFEKGFFINKVNTRVECFIKNMDWMNNPTSFKYKLTENGEIEKAEMNDVKEFSIDNSVKFVRAEVDIDTSLTVLSQLSNVRLPLWAHKQLFLKVLIEGKASLYFYRDGRFERFFYLCNDSVIKQLVYKEYLYEPGRTSFNYYFREQLLRDVKCSKTNISSVVNLNYDRKELENYFDSYNLCVDSTYRKFLPKKQQQNKFQILVSAGLDYSSLSVGNDISTYKNADFGNKLNVRFGAGVEYALPINKNKWGISMESNYQSFKGQKNTGSRHATIDFKSIDLSLGVKHYFFLKNSRIFIDAFLNSLASYRISFNLTSWTDATGKEYLNSDAFHVNPLPSLGTGYQYKKIFTEIRYYFTANIFAKNPLWFSEYNKLSFIIGYKIF